jgi:hypothetical protein
MQRLQFQSGKANRGIGRWNGLVRIDVPEPRDDSQRRVREAGLDNARGRLRPARK